MPYVDRTISVPPLYFLFTLSLNAARLKPPHAGSTFGMGFGFSTGIVDRLTAELATGPLDLLPDVRFHDLRFGLLYDLVDTSVFELEPTVHVNLGLGGGRVLSQVEPGLVMALHGRHQVRFDTGAYFPINLEKPAIGLTVPARAVVELNRHVHAAVSMAVSQPDLREVFRNLTVPLGFAIGYSAPLALPVTITVTPFMTWTRFLLPSSADPVHTNAYVVGVTTDLLLRP